MKRYSRLEVCNTFTVAKEQIENRDYFFFMRSKDQEEYHPSKIKQFTKESYRYAYRIQDMASLVSSNEISNFLSDIAYKLRSDKSHLINKQELELLKKFLVDADKEYKNSRYVPLDKALEEKVQSEG